MRVDPLKEGMATHSSILAWRIPRTEEPRGLQSITLQRVDTTEVTASIHINTSDFQLGFLSYAGNYLKGSHVEVFPGGSDGKASAYNAGDLG